MLSRSYGQKNEGNTKLLAQLLDVKKVSYVDAFRLLQAGADPNVKNSAGDSLLHILVDDDYHLRVSKKPGNQDYIKELIQVHHGKIDVKDYSGRTALHRLIDGGFYVDTVLCLLNLGADPNTKDSANQPLLHIFISNEYTDKGKKHDHFHAAINELLTTYKANINLKDFKGRTALHYLMDSLFYTDSAINLIRLGADPYTRNSSGITVLHILVSGNEPSQLESITTLVKKYKVDINCKDANGCTPLQHLISKKFNVEFAMNLVRLGADPNVKVHSSSTLLSILILENNASDCYGKSIEELVQLSQNPQSADANNPESVRFYYNDVAFNKHLRDPVPLGKALLKLLQNIDSLNNQDLALLLQKMNQVHSIITAGPKNSHSAKFIKEYDQTIFLWNTQAPQLLTDVKLAVSGYASKLVQFTILAESLPLSAILPILKQCYELDADRCIQFVNKKYGDLDQHLKQIEFYAQHENIKAKYFLKNYYTEQGQRWQQQALFGDKNGLQNLQNLAAEHPVIMYWLGRYHEEFSPYLSNKLPIKWVETKFFDTVTGKNSSKKTALDYYEKAAAKGCEVAEYRLGYCQQNGIGLTKNSEEALYRYHLAAQHGSSDAIIALKVVSYDEKDLKLAILANLYQAIRTGFQGDVKDYYNNSYLEKAAGLDKKISSEVILSFSKQEKFDVHTRIALLQILIFHNLLSSYTDKHMLLDLFCVSLPADDKEICAALQRISSYIRPDYFADFTLTLLNDSHYSLKLRALLLFTAQYLIKKEAFNNNALELKIIQNKLEEMPDQIMKEVRSELVFIPSAPPLLEPQPVVLPQKTNQTLRERFEKTQFKGEIPEKLIDPITKTLFEDPVIASDGETYDRSTIPLLKGISPSKQIPLQEFLITDFKKREKVISFIEKLEQQAKKLDGDNSNDKNHGDFSGSFQPKR